MINISLSTVNNLNHLMIIMQYFKFIIKLFLKFLISLIILIKINNIVIKSHKDDSDDNNNFRHTCTIAVFLLVRLFYLLIHLLNYLFKFV